MTLVFGRGEIWKAPLDLQWRIIAQTVTVRANNTVLDECSTVSCDWIDWTGYGYILVEWGMEHLSMQIKWCSELCQTYGTICFQRGSSREGRKLFRSSFSHGGVTLMLDTLGGNSDNPNTAKIGLTLSSSFNCKYWNISAILNHVTVSGQIQNWHILIFLWHQLKTTFCNKNTKSLVCGFCMLC